MGKTEASTNTDITGMRSGKLTALEKTDQKRRGSALWRCRCDCGKEVLLEAYKIRSARVTSCGCSRKGKSVKDITGRQFGRLTALNRLDKKKGSSYLWRCRCSCGKETEVSVNALLSGKIQSCGCTRVERMQNRAVDIRGKTFGMLTALEPLDRRYQNSVLWKCRCSCGNECEVAYNQLVSGNTTSCGCKKQMHEQPPLHYIDGTCIEMIERRSLRKDNTSGFTGVIAQKNGSWKAEITFQGKRQYLGTYPDRMSAALARKRAENRIFGEYLDSYYGKDNASKYITRLYSGGLRSRTGT